MKKVRQGPVKEADRKFAPGGLLGEEIYAGRKKGAWQFRCVSVCQEGLYWVTRIDFAGVLSKLMFSAAQQVPLA